MLTEQEKAWQNTFGIEYTNRNFLSLQGLEDLYRNRFGISRSEMNLKFLKHLNRSLRILEVGCNIGNQLLCLKKMGFNNLTGIEIQPYAVQVAKIRLKNIKIIQASISNLPFEAGFFDLVFTSGILIHINPVDIEKVLAEIYRCSHRYIWDLECFADEYEEIRYRGRKNLLWKTNFIRLWQESFPDLKLIKEKQFKYLDGSGNIDSMFLLEKTNPLKSSLETKEL